MTIKIHCDNQDCDNFRKEDLVDVRNKWLRVEDMAFGDSLHFCCTECLAAWSTDQSDHLSVDAIFRSIKRWRREALPSASIGGSVQKIFEEVHELLLEPTDILEMADIVIATVCAADVQGADLPAAIRHKMGINIERKWGSPDPDTGVIRHKD